MPLDQALRHQIRPERPADLFDRAAKLAALGCWAYDLDRDELSWSEAVFALHGLAPGSPLRRPAILDLYTDESRVAMEAVRAEVIATGVAACVDVEVRVGSATRWVRLWIDAERDGGRTRRIFGAQQDVTNEHQIRARLRRMAEREPLTGLANRAAFDARYRRVTADPLRHDHVAALALVDIDHFKAINDRLGHLAGDECLRQTAARLECAFAGASMVARIGGDEFAVLLRAPLGGTGLRRTLERAASILGRPVFWNGARIVVGVSIGAATTGHPTRAATGLFAEADAALYRAKAEGRGRVALAGEPIPLRRLMPRGRPVETEAAL